MNEQPAAPKGFTAAEMVAEAIGALGWLDDYTEPVDDRPQRRVRVEEYNDDHVIVRVEGERSTDEPDRRFRVDVTARELT